MDLQGQNGLMRTFREGWRSRNPTAILIAVALIVFYTLLYFRDELNVPPWLDLQLASEALGLRTKWFLYSALYCIAMIGGGVYYLRRHGNSRYNQLRIAVNIGVQLTFASSLPFVMPLLLGVEDPSEYWKYEYFAAGIYPLDWYKMHPNVLGAIPIVFALTTILIAFVAAPLLAFFFGKRWYCSWVCGCGGLANTMGDPWRHLTASSTQSWKFEKVAVHTVMFLAVGTTFLVILNHLVGDTLPWFRTIMAGPDPSHLAWWSVEKLYYYIVGMILAGVIGVGFYPLFGPRVWCRNFCPMAAMLGLWQKLGRFRIAVKKDMCISCGNCTTYCEMGIDVRSYAQSNESFTRAACVGCGMCAHVCPRGVLKLENAPHFATDKQRTRLPVIDL